MKKALLVLYVEKILVIKNNLKNIFSLYKKMEIVLNDPLEQKLIAISNLLFRLIIVAIIIRFFYDDNTHNLRH